MFSKTLPNYRYICQFQHTEFYPASIAIWIFCVWENALMVVEQQLPDYDGEPKLSFYAAWLVSSMLLRGTYYFPIDSNGKTTTKINKNRILLTSHLQNNGGGLQDDSCSILQFQQLRQYQLYVTISLVAARDSNEGNPKVRNHGEGPYLGPSPGWKRLLPLSHLRHY